jgi:hypothetical protein
VDITRVARPTAQDRGLFRGAVLAQSGAVLVRFAALMLASGLLAPGCLGGDCTTQVDRVVTLHTDPNDPALMFQMQKCRIDRDACTDLCTMTVHRQNIASSATSCEVAFLGDTALVKVSFEVSSNSPNCSVFADDVAEPGIK